MKIKYSIEKAQEKDVPSIFRILKQVNMHHIPSKAMPRLTLENYFVAKNKDEEVIGFSGYEILSKHLANTELMAVDEKYRGKSIGYLLQVRRMEDILSKGISLLTTNTDLPESIRWYKKHFGYKEVGQIKKKSKFSDPDIDEWTTLEVNLNQWNKERTRK